MKAPLVLRNRDFGLLWCSQAVSGAGSRMFQIALIWWIISQPELADHKGLLLGLLMMALAAPAVLGSRFIGRIIDNNSGKRILLTNDGLGVLLSLGLAGLFWLGTPAYGWLFGFAALFAVFQAFIDPTLNKALPGLVAEPDRVQAVAFISSTQTIAGFSGAVLGALAIESLGIQGVVLLNGLSFAISFICDGLIRFKTVAGEGSGGVEEPTRLRFRQLWQQQPTIAMMLLGFAVVNFFGTPVLVVLPLYTKVVLGGDAGVLAALEACIWLGILVGTFVAPMLGSRSHPLTWVSACLAMYAVFLGLPGVGLETLGYGSSLFMAGLALGMINVRMLALFQEVIHDKVKGQFFALLQAVVGLMAPLGFGLFGWLTDYVPLYYLCGLQGLGVIMVSGLFVLQRRRIKAKPVAPAMPVEMGV